MGMQVPPSIEPTVLPDRPGLVTQTQRASAGSFGAYTGAALERVGAAMGQAGDVAANNAIRFQIQQNETDVDAANTAYDNQRRDLLFSDGGFYTKKGKEAYDAMGPTSKAIEDLRNETRKNLANPEQQKMFDVISRRSTQMDLRAMDMHAATENQSYRVGVAEASISNAMADSASYWNDPMRFAKNLGEISVQAENRARLLGHNDPQQIRADVGHYTGLAWVERIKATMGENPLLARAMYEANKDQIYGSAQKVQLEHELKAAVQPEEAKLVARNIIAGAPAAGEGGGEKKGELVPTGGPKESSAERIERAERSLELMRAEKDQSPEQQREIARNEKLIEDLKANPREGAPGAAAAQPTSARDTKAQLASWLPAAEREAERLHPGNQTFKDLVTSQIKGYVSTITAMQEAQSRQAHSTVMAAAITPNQNGAKPVTVQDLLSSPEVRNAWTLLTPEAQHGFVSANGVLAQNGKEANGELVRSNPKLVNSLAQRMYLPEGDPQRISSPTQLTQYRGDGLNHTDYERLRKELAEANTPEGNPFLKQLNGVKSRAEKMLLSSSRGIMHPEAAYEAAYRFGIDLDNKLKAARADPKKDVQSFFTPGNPDYVLDMGRVASFMPTDAEIRAGAKPQAAPAAAAGAKPAPAGGTPKRNPGESPADFLKRIGKG